MKTKNYKKILNSQKLSTEINDSLKDIEKKSHLIDEFATSKPELIRELYDRLNDEERTAEIFEVIDNIDKKKNVEHLLLTIDRKNRTVRINKLLKVVSSIAAVLVVAFMVWQTSPNKDNQLIVNETADTTLLNPVLKLSSGKVYELVANGERASNSDINYIIGTDSKINIHDLQKEISKDSTIKGEEKLLLELSVPRQRSYTAILSDGTEVILNANSTIIYPEKFAADKREVTITGEVFFNVKKSTIPFIVSMGSSYVKVYGTSFNINARNQSNIETTLINGSVGIGTSGMTEKMLKPNQMAILNSNLKECQIVDVDANNSVGWRDGSIICLNNNLEYLINDLQAWYGVDIRYDKCKEIVKNTKMNILIKHTLEIDAALKLIEKVIDVKFINEGGYYNIEAN